MPQRPVCPFGPRIFIASLLGLASLPFLPELQLFLFNRADFKIVAPTFYYEGIISFLLIVPALLLPGRASRVWVLLMGALLAVPTVILSFYAAASGARWNMTAHTALMQTNSKEAWGYLEAFVSFGRVLWAGLLVAAFAGCVLVNCRAAFPRWRTRLVCVALGLVVSAYGIRNQLVYGGDPIRPVAVSPTESVRVFGIGVTLMHPLSLFAATQYNFKSTHRYYLQQYQRQHERAAQMAGAVTVPGAASPRVIVVVIGESATRRHWSLYGYTRETTPALQKRAGELLVFTDVISTSTGTLSSIRGMLSTSDSIPTFHLFSGAGYATRWISAQYNQGFDDLELAAFVSGCEPRIYLSGAYDENLIPLLEQAVAEPGRQMVFLNLMGSHVRYQDRYPAKFAVFQGATEAEHRRASYDNSIRYTDHVLDRMIALLRQRNESSCLIYFSDHGEDVYDSRPDKYLFRDDTLATDPMYEVPFVVWFSPEYVAGNADFVRRATAESPRRPFQNRLLYHTLLGLARLSHPLYDAHQDLFSPDFLERDRHVGVMERLYRKSP